jgi:hypothetical protein
MKTAMALLVVAGAAFNGAFAQPALTLSNPAVQSSPAPAMSLDTPALPTASPTNGAEPTAPTAETLPGMLLSLQAQVETLVPVLEQLNEGIEANVGTITTSGGNFGLNLGNNFSTSFATSFGANVSVPTRAVPSALAAGTGSAVQDTFRALLVLQNDLERILPALVALNGGTNQPALGGLTPGFVPGAFTNVFNISPGTP